jgi:hypothetical protein
MNNNKLCIWEFHEVYCCEEDSGEYSSSPDYHKTACEKEYICEGPYTNGNLEDDWIYCPGCGRKIKVQEN